MSSTSRLCTPTRLACFDARPQNMIGAHNFAPQLSRSPPPAFTHSSCYVDALLSCTDDETKAQRKKTVRHAVFTPLLSRHSRQHLSPSPSHELPSSSFSLPTQNQSLSCFASPGTRVSFPTLESKPYTAICSSELPCLCHCHHVFLNSLILLLCLM